MFLEKDFVYYSIYFIIMDILNFISWIRGKRIVTSVDPAKTLIPVGLKDDRRDDGYLAGAITVEDLANQIAPQSTYKVYTALLTQTGGTAPTSIVLENTIGSITFNRISPGFYEVLSSNLFVLGQMYLFLGNGNSGISEITENTTSSIYIVTRDITSDTPFIPTADDLLVNTTIEIRIYN